MCVKKNKFKDDEVGQAFTLDVMLALIIITVIMGISADAMDMASYKTSDFSARFTLERVTNDAADMLIKTPGSPDNWELGFNNLTTPGLAEIDEQTGKVILNTISMKKVNALSKNYNSLIYGKVLPQGVNSSLIIYPSNPSLSPIEIMKNNPENSMEVAVTNRTVIFNLIGIEAVNKNNSGLICPYSEHTSSGSYKWTCQNFDISMSEMNSTDFYIVTDPANVGDSPSWILDRPEKAIDNGTREKFSLNPININSKISNLLGNDSKGVLWFHVGTPANISRNFDAYIVSVPKGTNQTQVNLTSIKPEPWFLVLQVWY
ncbi:MAG: hypothetical protein ACXVHV_04040 [Methanobacterium sp.]